jgi:hypothetical protein
LSVVTLEGGADKPDRIVIESAFGYEHDIVWRVELAP